MTLGFDVFVQEVIEAITTAPLLTDPGLLLTVTGISLLDDLSLRYPGKDFAKELLASLRATRSWGRFGPAIDGTTLARSNSRCSE
jgi:hypothetical protein